MTRLEEAREILAAFGFDKARSDERSGRTLLALAQLDENGSWVDTQNPMLSVRAIIDWIRTRLDVPVADNARETYRRQTLHQFVDMGLVIFNDDNPRRPVNSPGNNYRLNPEALKVIRQFGTPAFDDAVAAYLTQEVPLPHRAGFHPDTDAGEDHLEITADVNMLADLVASRHVAPPLSIGLFGGWGSGKSFFMRRMRARVRALAKATADAEKAAGRTGPSVSAYCSSIRQVSFNAWHYAESNLWASLATHLLDNLASDGPEDDLERHANDLAEQRRHQRSLLDQLSSVRVERMLLTAHLERKTDKAPRPAEVARKLARVMAEEDWVTDMTQPSKDTLDEIRAFAGEATALTAEIRNLWRRLVRSRTSWAVLGIGVAAAVLLFLLVRSAVWPSIMVGLSFVLSLLPALGTVRRSVRRIRGTVDRLTARAEEATLHRLTELDAEQARLERAISDLEPTQDLTAFARSRDSSQDYRQHLSVVSLVRRDLEMFAAMLTSARRTTSRTTGPERIVLYIDDLDRCPPDVVVKVLEAIHLLLAQPVFTIVVGADVDWLLRSLNQHYGPVLDSGTDLDTQNGALHYLEKIFQIPLALAPMTTEGFNRLISDLGQNESIGTATPDGPVSSTHEPTPADQSRADSSRDDDTTTERDTTGVSSPPVRDLHLRPRQLEITREELDYIAGLAPLVRSPRAAKRLINLYRLVRARLQGDELTAFLEGPEPGYRAAIMLLAIMAGPTNNSRLFRAIKTASADTTWHGLLNDIPDLDTTELQQLISAEQVPSTITTYQSWLPLVRRFSFSFG